MKLIENYMKVSENNKVSMKTKKRLSREEKIKLVKKLYDEGYSYKEIAKMLRMSVRDISRILRGEEKEETYKIEDEIREIKAKLEKFELLLVSIHKRLEEFESFIERSNDPVRADETILSHYYYYEECPKCERRTYFIYDKSTKKWSCYFCKFSVPFPDLIPVIRANKRLKNY